MKISRNSSRQMNPPQQETAQRIRISRLNKQVSELERLDSQEGASRTTRNKLYDTIQDFLSTTRIAKEPTHKIQKRLKELYNRITRKYILKGDLNKSDIILLIKSGGLIQAETSTLKQLLTQKNKTFKTIIRLKTELTHLRRLSLQHTPDKTSPETTPLHEPSEIL